METVEKIDSDVESLHSELDRRDGKRHFRCDKRCAYILGIAGLLLAMFLFGVLTRPQVKQVTVTEVTAIRDFQAPRMIQPELSQRIATLRSAALSSGGSVPTLVSVATEPRILTWTPDAVGKTNPDGSSVLLVGSYEVPAGYFGVIRLTADGEEIGATFIDARAVTSASQGRFSITPLPITGQKGLRLAFDAVKACRIACDPLDQLCVATNVNYCTALYDNQSFTTYTSVLAEEVPPLGQCITKTFVAGPKYAPQIPEDYVMCAQGNYNSALGVDALNWLNQNLSDRVSSEDQTTFFEMVEFQIIKKLFVTPWRIGNISWSFKETKGNAPTSQMCSLELIVKVDCADETAWKTSMLDAAVEKGKSALTSTYAGLLALLAPQVAHADVNNPACYVTYYAGTGAPGSPPAAYGAFGNNCADLNCTLGGDVGQSCLYYFGPGPGNCQDINGSPVDCYLAVPSTCGIYYEPNLPGCPAASAPTTLDLGVIATPVPDIILPTTAFTETFFFMTSLEPFTGIRSCRLLDWSGTIGLTPFIPCESINGSISDNVPSNPAGGVYGYHVQAMDVSPTPSYGEVTQYVDSDGNGFPDNYFTVTVHPAAPLPECSDGVDNGDAEDTLIDMADSGCTNPSDNDETYIPSGSCADTLISWGGAGGTCSGYTQAQADGYSGTLTSLPNATSLFVTVPPPYIDTDTGIVFAGTASMGGSVDISCSNGTWVTSNPSCGVCQNIAVPTPATMGYEVVDGGTSGFNAGDGDPWCIDAPTPLGGACMAYVAGDPWWTGVCPPAYGGPLSSCITGRVHTVVVNPFCTPGGVDLTVAGGDVDFGNVPVGVVGSTQTFVIINTGGTDFNGWLQFFDNGPHDSYSCFGGPTVSVPALDSISKTCTLITNMEAPLGGLSQVTDGTYAKAFNVTATAIGNSQLDIFNFTAGEPVIASYPAIDMGTLAANASVENYDFVISNAGSSVMNYAVTIIPGGAPGYSLSGECGGTINTTNPLDVCRVTFDPTAAGVGGGKDATIHFDNTSTPNTPPDSLDVNFTATVQSGPISGIGSSGPISTTGPIGSNYTLDFGARTIGSPTIQSLGIYNTGDQPLVFTCTDATAATGPDFTTSGCGTNITVPPLGSHAITVTFTPSMVAVTPVVISIDGNAANFPPGGNMTLTLLGSGIATPSLTVTPDIGAPVVWGSAGNISFPDQDVTVGPSGPKVIIINNGGSVSSTVTLSVDDPAFIITPVSNNIVPPGGSRTFEIRFDPSAPPALHNGTITITATGVAGPTLVYVNGNGVVTPIGITPASISFGNVALNKQQNKLVTISNNDPLGRSFGIVDLTLSNPSFTCVSGCQIDLPLNAQRDVTLRFTPTVIGSQSADLVFTSVDMNINGFTIPVTGKGVLPKVIYKEK